MSKHVVVLGAGVTGLTTALTIQELYPDVKVTIVAEAFQSDPRSIKYTSHWAAAHHANSYTDETRLKMARECFDRMWDMSAPGADTEHCFLRITQSENFKFIPDPNPYVNMPDYTELPKEALPPNTIWGCTFTTITIDVPVYLSYLSNLFLSNGGSFVRAEVSHIQVLLEGGIDLYLPSPSADTHQRGGSPTPDAVVVCTGLGARTLGGVEDKAVYPIRGQTIVARAPWIRNAKTVQTDDEVVSFAYIVPRRSGDVLIGGTENENDWFPKPRPETASTMLSLALISFPELRSPDTGKVEIVYEGCGLRPARKGGLRIEVEEFEVRGKSGKVPVVHHYGHAGSGYSLSWGSASVAVKLLGKALGLREVGST